MKACEQAPGYSVYQHGLDVANRYRALYEHVCGERTAYRWEFDDEACQALMALRKHALSPRDARLYHVYHDCGKPDVLTIDELGKRHFPNHAEASAKAFRAAFSADERTASLIEHDMLCHVARSAELESLAQVPDIATLVLTAWAELHANAERLFGGFESDSFKIKRKRLAKLTKSIAHGKRT
jgi:hypothetical protein